MYKIITAHLKDKKGEWTLLKDLRRLISKGKVNISLHDGDTEYVNKVLSGDKKKVLIQQQNIV